MAALHYVGVDAFEITLLAERFITDPAAKWPLSIMYK
jgi:hypothetical protein